ncbi:hypothetical protein JKG47_02960 [Acidithiobacillus sp. MC6.1]|nr:hypothetical protein [Acidithiobacillus sp. MC6.1]
MVRKKSEMAPFCSFGRIRCTALPWSLYKRCRYWADLEYAGMRTPLLAAVWINNWLDAPQPLPAFHSEEKRHRVHRFPLPADVWTRWDICAARFGRKPEALLWDLLAYNSPIPDSALGFGVGDGT